MTTKTRARTKASGGAFGTRFSEAELEQIAADERSSTDADDAAWTVDDGSDASASGMTTMSIRLPTQTLAALKAAALELDVGTTTLARRWITERLAQQVGLPEVTGSVDIAELWEFLALRARAQTGRQARIANLSHENVANVEVEFETQG